MNEPMTFKKAMRRIAATALQAAVATGLLWIGLAVSDNGWNGNQALLILASAFAVPLMTAIQRLAQAWHDKEWGDEAGYGLIEVLLAIFLILVILIVLFKLVGT